MSLVAVVKATISIMCSECMSYSLSYPAPNSPHCHLLSVLLYNIFPHYILNGTIFGRKKVIERKMCFDFLYKSFLKYLSF
jgi:hypothetical protein